MAFTLTIFIKNTISKEKVGTKEFAEAVIKRFGEKPQKLKKAHYSSQKAVPKISHHQAPGSSEKETVGVDIFIESDERLEQLHKKLEALNGNGLKLMMIGNRGVKVWPEKMPETFCTDVWRCRFMSPDKKSAVSALQIVELQKKMAEKQIAFIHTEHLCTFDGRPGYTLAQDEQ